MKIYFAGPLFSVAEQNFNKALTEKLELLDYEVFLPQRDGAELNKSPFIDMTIIQRNESIFSIDREQVLKCDIFLFVLDGRVPDEGACFELGMAYTQKYLSKSNKQILGLHTDTRASFLDSKLNAMIQVPFDKIFSSENDLLEFILRMLPVHN
ncbi:nucleoside 2-deoxyribosyltransferase [Tenacibaculum soleae]|uniref:nucleoside 2-deoxyribosyltransferase n=1 Tax=Tenacibaculum soleae TaxID=447689 RepID=UPI0023016589|nr:nucleoside 2-deoxyribosyltransferase [Tenacibaculum soleae]